MPDTVRKLLALLTRREKIQLSGIAVATLMMGLLQVAGVGSIMPFVTLLTDAGGAEDNAFLEFVFGAVGARSDTEQLLLLGGGALSLIVIS
ncbi:MAG: ABC transporter ATP-binding protein, partial [Chloroflexota bacterium]